MIKFLFVIPFVLVLNDFANAQNPNFEWAKSLTTCYGISIELDTSGNIYVAGYFGGTADFDPGPAVYNITALSTDIFILKLSPQGNLIWVRTMGSYNSDLAISLAVDKYSNVYTTGLYRDTVDFDPGPGVFNLISAPPLPSNINAIFISKLDSSGSFVWAKSINPTTGLNQGSSIVIDCLSNVNVTGYFEGIADFDPGPAINNLTSADGGIFILKLDSAGNYIWAKNFGGDIKVNSSVAVDKKCNVFVVSQFNNGIMDFDPGPGAYILNSSSGGTFIEKLDSAGNFVWAKNFGSQLSPLAAYPTYLTIDTSGYIYITGDFFGAADFDPGIGTFTMLSAGNFDIYFMRLDSLGNFNWSEHVGGNSLDFAGPVVIDSQSNLYMTGYFSSIADFDPTSGVYNLSCNGNIDIYILKVDNSGNFLWAGSMGGTSGDRGADIIVDPSYNIFTCGSFAQSVDFDPGSGIYNINASTISTFVHKLDQCIPSYSSNLVTACDSFSLNGQTYFSSGTYSQTLVNLAGCDSLVILNLTINQSAASVINLTTCDSVIWNGQTYSLNGTYTQIINNGGCDSLATLNLTVNQNTSFAFNQTGCDSIVFNGQTFTMTGIYTQTLTNATGCDSTIELHLIINNSGTNLINTSACDSLTLNGQTYSQSGNYIQTLVNSYGCDSVLTLNITITSIDTSVIQSSSFLLSNEPFANYQWIDCSNMVALPNATQQQFTPLISGSYAVVITNNSCVDTSLCYNVTVTGIASDYSQDIKLLIFPNPVTGNLFVFCNIDIGSLNIYDITGKLVYMSNAEYLNRNVFDLSNLKSGLYLLKLVDKMGNIFMHKISKN